MFQQLFLTKNRGHGTWSLMDDSIVDNLRVHVHVYCFSDFTDKSIGLKEHYFETGTVNLKSEHRIHKWLVFASACLVMIVPVGFFYSLGALFVPFMNTFQASRTEASLIQSVAVAVSLSTSFIHGPLMHRFGMVKTGLAGATLASLGLGVSFFATSIPFLISTIGIAAAVGTICMYIASSAAVGRYFSGKQSLFLLSVVNGCSGVGGMIFPFVLAFLNNNFSLWGTLLICAGLVMNTIPCSLLWTHPHRQKRKNKTESHNNPKDIFSISHELEASSNNSRKSEQQPQYGKSITLTASMKHLLKNGSFIYLTLGLAISYPPIMVLITIIADAFQDSGFSTDDANLGFLLLNACGIIGRLLPGVMMQSRRTKTMYVPILASIIAAGAMAGLVLTKTLQMKLLFSSLCGISYGMFVSCFSVTVLDIVGADHLGNAIGLAFTCNGLANIAAGPVSGFIRDRTGSYLIVFILASGVQFVAVCMFLLSQTCLNTKTSSVSSPTIFVTKL